MVVGGGTAVGAKVGRTESVATVSRAGDWVVTAVGEAAIRVGVGCGATVTAHAFNSPKQSSSKIKGRMMIIARLRLERRRGVVVESSIGAAF